MNLRFVRVALFSTCLVALSGHAAQSVPQIPAFLPMAHAVPQTSPLPIDGEWMITSISKRVRIQSGRAFAVDPWVHMFVLQIQPMMVVIRDIKTTGPTEYSGSDLPLMGTWQARLGADGTLSVSVQSVLGPVGYTMIPVSMDDPDAFESAKRGEATRSGGEEPDEEEYVAGPEPEPDPIDDDEDWDW